MTPAAQPAVKFWTYDVRKDWYVAILADGSRVEMPGSERAPYNTMGLAVEAKQARDAQA